MKLIPKYQKAGLIARRDNTNVDTPNPYDKLTYKFQYTPRQETLSSDTRPESQREQGKKRAELEYKAYDRARREEEGLQHLNAFLEFTDYAGLASGAGSIATKGAKSIGKRLISKRAAQNVDNDLLNFLPGFSPEPISTPLTAEATKEFFDYDVLPRFRKLGNEIPTSPDKSWYTYTREVLPKGVTGQHWVYTGKIDISHRLPRDKAEAVKAHEFRHKLDKLNPLNDSQKDYLNKTYRVFNNTSIEHPGSNTLSERMATNTELRFKYFNELKGNLGRIPSVRELDEYIDSIPESAILDDISKVNGYGFDYTNSLLQTMNNNKGRLSSEEIFKGGKSWLKNIKTTMKAVPVLSPFLINNKQ